jgi:hypothetical protein
MEFGFRDGELFEAKLAQGLPSELRLEGEGGGALVPHERDESGGESEALIKEGSAVSGQGLEFLDAFVVKELRSVAQELDGIEKGVCEERHHGVELEVAACGCPSEGGVVADDARAGLEEALTDDRVHLARHDGATWLARWHSEFAESSVGSAGHPAEVVGDLGKGDGQSLEEATHFHECIAGGLGFDVIEGFLPRQIGEAREFYDGMRRKVWVAVDAGAHRGASKGEFEKCAESAADALAAECDLAREGPENLAETDGCGVHEVGAPEFEDGIKFGGFFQES